VVGTHRPDVVVLDVRMPPTHTDEGLRAALAVRDAYPGIGVLVLSQYVEKRFAVELLSGDIAGVGYLLKDRVAAVTEFLDALSRVGGGGSAFDPEVVRRLLSGVDKSDVLGSLTPGEHRVLRLMAAGHTNTAIARRLHVSRSAVEKHVASIFTKFDLPASSDYSKRVLAVLRYFGE
ncbi:LuxR C-terminal-related transcriptional regulator, partial [Stackebrandtia soli]|uniref:LuxR C-terminal-related transcriptional regulator n=1 Tax=Stackebrandtia soli TaxID=1892856 RepID=UPI0039EAE3AC